jgi:hypothetical protein
VIQSHYVAHAALISQFSCLPLLSAGITGVHHHIQLPIFKNNFLARYLWLTPVILTTQEAEIRRFEASPEQIVPETLSRKKMHHKK